MDFEHDIIKKEKKKKTRIITETSFGFDGDKIKLALRYQGNGTAPDKRFDTNCEGLCLFISPKGMITFYAFKYRPMFNKLGGLFIERIQTMNINTELSEEDINDKIKKIFPTKEDFQKGQSGLMEGLYEEESNKPTGKKKK